MAKKPRTPPPPRGVQAPRKREQERSAEDRRRLLMLVGFAALGLLALAAVIGVVALTGGGDSEVDAEAVRKAVVAAGCTYTEKPAKPLATGGVHVATIDTPVKWPTYPPAAGPHYGQTAVWGFYEQPAEPIRIVHNEEHGGVVLWWGPQTPQAEVERLNTFYSDDPVSMFGTPIAGLGRKVAISAWTGDPAKYQRNGDFGEGHLAVCQKYDDATEEAFAAFRDKFRGNGPEGVPADQNQPGSGPG
jgi:hypothetical protein